MTPSDSPSLQQALDAARTRTAALLEIPRLYRGCTEAEFLQRCMELVERLTESRIAFVHFIHSDENEIELVTWSRRTLEESCTAVHDSHYPVSEAGIWANAVRTRRPFVCDDYAAYPEKHGLPEGHAHLKRLISVPVLWKGRVVMLAGVGNKETSYDASDVETVELLAQQIWQVAQLQRERSQVDVRDALLDEIGQLGRVGGWSWTVETGQLHVTPNLDALLGPHVASKEAELAALLERHPARDREVHRTAIAEALANGTPYDLTLRVEDEGGLRWLRCTVEAHSTPGGVTGLTGAVQDVTRLQEVNEKLRRMQNSQLRMASRSVAIREQERSFLARELHDGVGQLLTAIRMDLALLDHEVDDEKVDPEPGTLGSVGRLVDDSLAMIQDIAARMREPILDDLGLVAALTSYLREFEIRSSFRCVLTGADFDRPLPPPTALAVFRIVQEALTNAVRHSRGSRIDVRLALVASSDLLLEVEDNGVGVDPAAVHAPTSIGLQAMRERARDVGGLLEFSSSPGRGTVVRGRFHLIDAKT